MNPFRRISKSSVSRLVVSLGVMALLLSVAAPSAFADPSLIVELKRDAAEVSRSDERVDYEVSVKNTATDLPTTGDRLFCDGAPPPWGTKSWYRVVVPNIAYQWVRNGTSLISAEDKAHGSQTSTYEVQATDVGAIVQCVVTGTNPDDENSVTHAPVSVSEVEASLPATVISPVPSSSLKATRARPRTPSTELEVPGSVLHCKAPAPGLVPGGIQPWTGTGITWSFEWLGNGVPLGNAHVVGGTATTSDYEIQNSDSGTQLQCKVTATDANGLKAVGFSPPRYVHVVEGTSLFEDSTSIKGVSVEFANTTSGPVKVEVEIPGGSDTSIYKIFKPEGNIEGPPSSIGWTCSAQSSAGVQPAKATCERSDSLAPQAAYPTFAVAAALGADTPDTAIAKATVSGGAASSASASDEFTFGPTIPFGISFFDAGPLNDDGSASTAAGGHPFSAGSTFTFNQKRKLLRVNDNKTGVIERVQHVNVETPRGFVGNALAVPKLCPAIEDVLKEPSTCPPESIVGGIDLETRGIAPENLPIYALEPEYGVPAQFAFGITDIGSSYTFVPKLRAEDGYAISLEASPVVVQPELLSADATLCGFGAKMKLREGRVTTFDGCKKATEPGANPKPLVTNPTRCAGTPPTVNLKIDSWTHPGDFKSKEFVTKALQGCESIPFTPSISISPTNTQADTPTGMNVEIRMPTDGLESKTGISQANLDTSTVTFPEGMSVNPASADGLSACTPAQIKLKSNADDECPLSSKVGTIEIDTPLIRETLTGNVYVASQGNNPFNSTLGLYMAFSSKKDGITIKVAGKLVPDPVTGQLTTIFTENPEAPFSRLALHFNEGPRAPLINPPQCGTYAIHSEFSPWSAVNPANPTSEEIVFQDSEFEVLEGPGGGLCPQGKLEPKLKAGLTDTTAASKSPFVMRLSREDGSQRFSGLELKMPPGLVATLKGVPYCPESVLAGISTAELTGKGELSSPACPSASQVGTVSAGAGAGPFPFFAQGRAYLAGPYKGAPLSIVAVTPAVAGPFDLGNVVIRNALYVDPTSAQVTVKSDPIPTILHGLLLDVRDIRVNVDRPNFTQAPTNCEPSAIAARISGQGGAIADVSNRFQVGGCEALAFKPNLNLRLFGGTHRGAHPKLRATLTYPPGGGYANVAAASVALPHSEFLEQAHIRTICTRVQFAADACPAASIYGKAEATTPLLDSPLSGPVYLRSSSNPLPDLVVALRGPDSQPIEVVLAGKVDSVNAGIRNSFEVVPDAPVSSFTLTMQGGKKGLLVNSRNICSSVNKATAKFKAQNGDQLTLRPKLRNSCGKVRKGKKQEKHQRGR